MLSLPVKIILLFEKSNGFLQIKGLPACIAKEIRMFGRYCRKSGIEIEIGIEIGIETGIETGKRKSLFHSSCAFLSDAVCLVPDVCGETDAIVYCIRKEKY